MTNSFPTTNPSPGQVKEYLNDLLDSIDRALNDKKYSPEYPPIVQKNCLFVEIPDNPRC